MPLCQPMKKLRTVFTRRTEIAIEKIFKRNKRRSYTLPKVHR